jgi:transposase-like protein
MGQFSILSNPEISLHLNHNYKDVKMETVQLSNEPLGGTKIIRHFSQAFKQHIVKEIEAKKLRPCEVVRIYEVSEQSVYKWISRYSSKYQKGVRMVLELESEGARIEFLTKKLGEAEQLVGKKQIEIELLNKIIEICSDELGYDVKKKHITQQSKH